MRRLAGVADVKFGMVHVDEAQVISKFFLDWTLNEFRCVHVLLDVVLALLFV
jgi:hypothetical protein